MEGSGLNRQTSRETRGNGRRDIDAILRRQRKRREERTHHFAPDMMHGSVAIGAIYDVLGRRWPEKTAFVDAATNRNGEVVAWSLGRFDDHFLKVEHTTETVRQAVCEWMQSRLSDASRVVVRVGGNRAVDGLIDELRARFDVDVTRLACSVSQLELMETEHLDVTRDFSLRADPRRGQTETQLQSSRLNILTIVGLCTVWTQ